MLRCELLVVAVLDEDSIWLAGIFIDTLTAPGTADAAEEAHKQAALKRGLPN